MAQNPQQFAEAYPYWPQATFSHLGQSYPLPTGQHGSHYPPMGQPPQSIVQMLSRELAAAQRRLWEYTDMISGLCAELELIRGIVCHACKERISPRNFAQHPSTFSTQNLIVAPVELHNMGSQQTSALPSPHTITEAPVTSPFLSSDVRNALSRQTNLQNAQQTSFLPPSSTPTTHTCSPPMSNILASSEPAESFFIRPRTPLDVDSAVVDQPIIQKSPWSVMYNSEINQMLEITFIHAFNHSSSALSVRFSPDGNFLAAGLTCDLGRIHIYDVRTMSLECALAEYPGYSDEKKYPSKDIFCMCFSPDGRYLVVGGTFKKIYIWDIVNKKVLTTFKGHTGSVRSLDVSPDGRLLVTGSFDRSVRIWKIHDGSSKFLSTEGECYTSVRFSPNSRYVAASNSDNFLRIWDVRSGHLVGKWKDHEGMIRSVAFSPNGEKLVSGGWEKQMDLKCWDVSPLKVSPRLDSSENGLLLQNSKQLEFDRQPGYVYFTTISPDGKWVATGSSDKCVRIWDLRSGMWQCTLEGHIDELWMVDFSPIGNYIATGSADGFVTLWRYTTVSDNCHG